MSVTLVNGKLHIDKAKATRSAKHLLRHNSDAKVHLARSLLADILVEGTEGNAIDIDADVVEQETYGEMETAINISCCVCADVMWLPYM